MWQTGLLSSANFGLFAFAARRIALAGIQGPRAVSVAEESMTGLIEHLQGVSLFIFVHVQKCFSRK